MDSIAIHLCPVFARLSYALLCYVLIKWQRALCTMSNKNKQLKCEWMATNQAVGSSNLSGRANIRNYNHAVNGFTVNRFSFGPPWVVLDLCY